MVPGPSAPAPDVRLELPARAANVAVVRQALAGVTDTADVADALVGDMKIAVTEACANSVVHAYRDGEGPLGVSFWLDARRLAVRVRDEGPGVNPLPPSGDDEAGVGYGLALIASLSDRFAVHGGPTGTVVDMVFELAPDRPAEPADVPAAAAAVELAAPAGGVALTVVPGPLAASVLGRVVSMLAARVDFSIDRLSDAQLVSDAIANHVGAHTVDGRLRVLVEEAPRGLELCVGPLVAGGARGLVRDTELPSVGPVLERLSDGWDVEVAGGDGERLRLRLLDPS